MYFIGIDIGTTNTKICLFEGDEFECVYKYSFKSPIITNNDESEFDVIKLWENMKEGLKLISKKVRDITEIKSISIASVGEAGVLVDSYGNIFGPAITWYDKRANKQLEYIHSKIKKEEIYKITGLPSHTNYSINKILWIKDNVKKGPIDNYKWLCIAEYFVFKLTSKINSEFSLSSRTMMIDLESRTWSKKLLGKLDLSSKLFADLISSGEPVGIILNDIADEIGFSRETCVSIAGHDHMCGSVAAGLVDDNEILNSTGTTEGILILQNKLNNTEKFFEKMLSNGIDVLEDKYTLFASQPSAGYSVEWAMKSFFKNGESIDKVSMELIKEESKIGSKDTNSNVDGSSSEKLIFIPHLRGSGPPNRSTASRCLFYGLTEHSTPNKIMRSVFEGLCYELRIIIDEIEKTTKRDFNRMKVIGSACRNPFWLQLKADILNKEILACEIDEAVAKGAAILSAHRMGYISNLNKISLLNKFEVYKPNLENYEKYSKVFNELYLPFYKFKIGIENNK
ncbi:FGGY family carbohydrate kinase [Clostridium sp. C8]|uniref:FGGY-family carbohydrate kinase n=1 Tax=Clostridium sp. C8 TaxID=1667357 RepID=UPI00062E435C|nr:FGGY family carbohydrate kinase [Clostridium sp. C8]KLE15682.1 hypothetical protein AAT22_10210 [Clostridium sp. C8]